MRYLTVILFLIGFNTFGQFNEMLLASQAQAVVVNPELYTDATAISIANESTNITTNLAVSAGTKTLQTGGADTGTYYVSHSGANGNRLEITWTVPSTGNYTFSIAAKTQAGQSGGFNQWTNVQTIGGGVADPNAGGGAQNFSNTAWQTYTWNLECTATTGIARVYLNGAFTVDTDSFSIKAYTP